MGTEEKRMVSRQLYEKPLIEVQHVEMEDCIAGSVFVRTINVSDTMIEGGELILDDDADSNNDFSIKW